MRFLVTILLTVPLLVTGQEKSNGGFAAIGASVLHKNNINTFGGVINVGYKLSKYATLGGGVEFYKFRGDATPYFPLYGHLKIYFNNKNVRPYITLAPGYGVYNKAVPGISNTKPGAIKGGAFIAGSIGAHFRDIIKSEKLGPFLQVGIKHQSFKTKGVIEPPIEIGTSYFSIDLGFRF